jgi:DNA-directed RNA polymerase subunit RPC12/RpoP
VTDKYSQKFGGDNCKECSKHRKIGEINWDPNLVRDFAEWLQSIANSSRENKKCSFCGKPFIPESGSYGMECKECGVHVNYKGKSLEELKNGA